jgi:hypothetical protein
MLDSKSILKYVQSKNKNVSLEEIDQMIKEQNREDILNTEKKRFRYEIWDKKMAINGVDAKEIIKSRDYTIGQAYIIYVDGNILYFQDHNPNEEGYVKMTKAQAKEIAEDFIQKTIELSTDNIITTRVIEKILSK